jgi:site-specific DNA-methyltransferase (adenine-specific)
MGKIKMSRTKRGQKMAQAESRVELNRVYQGDCLELLEQVAPASVDLVFADPPFNIGFTYDTYDDRLEYDDYVTWSKRWIEGCKNVLKPNGSFYIAIGDEFAAEIRMIGRDLGLHLRNWIIWHYTFGQSTKMKFARAHAHVFYFVMDAGDFVFNDQQVRFPSARHTEYSDKRANPAGRVPDDVWDEFPRVCGTFSERQGWHGCQMPEALLARIIRTSSHPADLVLDPFSGSGTTVVTAAKLERRFLGFDLSSDYVAQAQKRLAGVEESRSANNGDWTPLEIDTLCSLYRETNTARVNLTPNDVAMTCFALALNSRIGSQRNFGVDEIRKMLERLDSQNRLPRLRNDRLYAPRQPSNGSASRRNGQHRHENSGKSLLF